MNRRILMAMAAMVLVATPGRAALIDAGNHNLDWSAGPVAVPIVTIGDGAEAAFAVDLRLSIVGDSPSPLIDGFSLDLPGALFEDPEYHTPFPDPNNPSPPAAEATGGAADFRPDSSPRIIPTTPTQLAIVQLDLSQLDTGPEGTTWDWLLSNSVGDTAFSGTETTLAHGTLSVGPRNEWAGPGGGEWTLPGSWTAASVPSGPGAAANFLGNITGPSAVTIGSGVTVGTVTFDSLQDYTIAGPATLSLGPAGGPARINVLAGHHTITAPVAIAGDLALATEAGSSLAIQPAGYAFVSPNLTKQGDGTCVLGGGLVLLGGLDVQAGTLQTGEGSLAFAGPDLHVAEAATLEVSGTVNRRVTGDPGANLVPVGAADIGVLSSTDGYDFQGALVVGANTVGLKDADWAKVYRGATLAGGRLTSFNGIEVQAGNVLRPTIQGYGTIDGAVRLNGGSVGGTSRDQPIVFSGILSGTGSLRNVLVTGLARLGNSPSYTPVGGVSFTATEMEIEGPAAGSGYFDDDQLVEVVTTGDYDQLGANGEVTLGGAVLTVTLLNGYEPDPAKDSFLLFDHIDMPDVYGDEWVGRYVGWFDQITLPAEMSADDWYWQFTYADGTISEGQAPLGDFTHGVLTAGATVPEPATLLLLLTASLALAPATRRRRRV